MADELDLVKISELPAATTPGEYDVLAGVQTGDTKQFSFAVLQTWMEQAISATAIGAVPQTRKINGISLTSDVTLSASSVGAIPASDKGSPEGVAELDSNGKVPGSQLDLSGKQGKITASGILKGDGAGGVSAATPGTDYQAPLTAGTDYATPAQLDAKANQAQLATVETGTTASRAYAVGEYFCWNGLLYRVTAAISNGGSFTPGTNCEQATVGAELKNRAPAGFGLGIQLNTLTSISDCDTVDETGWFCTSIAATANCPSGATNRNAVLYSVVRGSAFAVQEFYDYGSGKVFRRWKNTTWGSWVQV